MKKNIKKGIFILGIIVLMSIFAWQFIKINNLSRNANLPPSPWLDSFYDAGNDDSLFGGYVSAKGTWESNLKLAYPYNINQIDCWKKWEYCFVAEAYTTGYERNNMINTDINYLEIESWDSYKIIAKNTGMCAETILTIDRTSEKITEITTPINTETDGCKSGAKLLGEIEVQTNVLIDGSKKWIDEFISHKK